MTIQPDRRHPRRLVRTAVGPDFSWSPDGGSIAATRTRSHPGLYRFRVGGGRPVLLSDPIAQVVDPSWAVVQPAAAGGSPQVAFVSTRDGVDDVYTMNPHGGGQRRLTVGAATVPCSSRDQSQLAYVAGALAGTAASPSTLVVAGADGTGPTPSGHQDGLDRGARLVAGRSYDRL